MPKRPFNTSPDIPGDIPRILQVLEGIKQDDRVDSQIDQHLRLLVAVARVPQIDDAAMRANVKSEANTAIALRLIADR